MRSIILSELGRRVWNILRFFLLLGLSFVILYPLLFMLSNACKPIEQTTDPSVIWIPKSFTLNNFDLAIQGMKYGAAFTTTLLTSGVSSILQVCSCALIGYGFARFQFKERGLLFACVLFTIIVPPQVVAVPTYQMYFSFTIPVLGPWLESVTGWDLSVNLINSPLVTYIPAMLGVGLRSGVYIFVFRQFFRGIPKELEEAATVDGCGALRTFLRIMVPNAGSAFLTVFLFSFVWYWNDYFNSSIFLPSRRTLAVSLTMLRLSLHTLGVNYLDPFSVSARLQAGALLTVLPVLVIFLFLQKYFTEGIERTGLVG